MTCCCRGCTCCSCGKCDACITNDSLRERLQRSEDVSRLYAEDNRTLSRVARQAQNEAEHLRHIIDRIIEQDPTVLHRKPYVG